MKMDIKYLVKHKRCLIVLPILISRHSKTGKKKKSINKYLIAKGTV